MLEIVIANTAEAFATLLDRAGAGTDRAMHEADLAGRALFWGGPEKIVVTPHAIDPALIAHTAELLGSSRLEVWHPSRTSLRLSRDILDDAELVERLRCETCGPRPFLVRPYAITPEFCDLSEHLEWGSFREALRAATELDSKAGFRRIFGSGRLPMPEGWICDNLIETAIAAHALAEQGRQAVLKVHNGESGWGLHFFDPSEIHCRDLPEYIDVTRSLLDTDPIWSVGPYIVEERLKFDRSDPGYSPSGEATVDRDGVHFDYLCHQLVSDDGEFTGVSIGAEVERSRYAEAIRQQTLVVGDALHARSYRGTYDVDFVVDLAGEMYAVESNVRLTGGTHVIGAARALFGDRWRDKSLVSNDCIRYGAEPLQPALILERLKDILLRTEDPDGIIISFISGRRPVIGAIAVASDQAAALCRLENVERYLRSG